MARIKRPINYIEELLINPKTSELGRKLEKLYHAWIKSLKLEDFHEFIDLIEKNKQFIGVAQFFGKFRAYSLEEYVFRLLKNRISIPKKLEVYWGEKCLISKPNEREYFMEADIIIGQKLNEYVIPTIVIDTKIELDASRFKTALASFMLIKRAQPKAKCFLVYLKREIDKVLLQLANPWINGTYSFNPKANETKEFLKAIQNSISST